jgi:hypothetical protein
MLVDGSSCYECSILMLCRMRLLTHIDTIKRRMRALHLQKSFASCYLSGSSCAEDDDILMLLCQTFDSISLDCIMHNILVLSASGAAARAASRCSTTSTFKSSKTRTTKMRCSIPQSKQMIHINCIFILGVLGSLCIGVAPFPIFTAKPAPMTWQQLTGSSVLPYTQQAMGITIQAAAPSVEFTPSVFIFTLNDVETSKCKDQVTRAAQFATRSIQFVTTTYWVDAANDGIPDSYCLGEDIKVGTSVTPYCRDWSGAYKTGTYRSAFYAGLRACLNHGFALGFTGVITLNPRFDQWAPNGGGRWRAELTYDPMKVYGKLSYYDTLLKPHAEMARDLAAKAGTWRMVLGGEHMYTITAFPDSNSQALAALRAVAPSECSQSLLLLLYACASRT